MKLTEKYRKQFAEEAKTDRAIGYFLYLFLTACLWILNDFRETYPVTIANVLIAQTLLAILLALVYGVVLWKEYRGLLQLQRQKDKAVTPITRSHGH